MAANPPLIFRTRATQNVGPGLIHGTDEVKVQQANLIEDRLRGLENMLTAIVSRLNGSTTSPAAVTGLSNTLPKDVAGAAVVGTSTKAMRADAVMRGLHSLAVQGESQLFNDVELVPGLGVLLTQIANQVVVALNLLAGTNITLTPVGDALQIDAAASGGNGNFRYYDNILPVDSGDGQHFTLPDVPTPAEGLELYASGKLIFADGADYTLDNETIFSPGSVPEPGKLRAWFIVPGGPYVLYANITPTATGDPSIFTLPAAPNPPESLDLYDSGTGVIAGNDFTLASDTITFNYVPPDPAGLRCWFRALTPVTVFYDDITPTPTGDPLVFTLPVAPDPPDSLRLFDTGKLDYSGGDDYTLAGVTVTFVVAPADPTTLRARFRAQA